MRECVALALLLGMAGYTVAAEGQTAEMTIYSHGSWASELKPVSRNAIFKGGIWDGGEPMLMFTDRPWITNDRYVVLELPAGVHVFGTGEGNKPRRSSLLTVTLQAGERYFLRVHASSNYFGERSDFEAVSCQVARGDLAQGKALGERAVMKEKRGLLSGRQEVPVCPAGQP